MAFQLIASHIQHELQEEADRRRLERLVRRGRPAGGIDRLRVVAGQRLVTLGIALGGDAVSRPPHRQAPARRVAT